MQLTDGVYKVDGVGVANVYLVAIDDGLLLVDTGMPGNARRIAAFMESLGNKAGDLRYIVLTHCDIDHIGSAAAVKELTGSGPFDEWIQRFSDHPRPDPGARITTQIPVAEYFGHRDAALRAHETQIDPDSAWFAVPHHVEAEVWGTDDYELARSLIDTTLPESDLFAGVRERVS